MNFEFRKNFNTQLQAYNCCKKIQSYSTCTISIQKKKTWLNILSIFFTLISRGILLSACKNILTSHLTLKSTALARHTEKIKPHRTWPGYSTFAPLTVVRFLFCFFCVKGCNVYVYFICFIVLIDYGMYASKTRPKYAMLRSCTSHSSDSTCWIIGLMRGGEGHSKICLYRIMHNWFTIQTKNHAMFISIQ